MSAVRRFIGRRLRLEFNEEKSEVDRPRNLNLLGLTFLRRDGIEFECTQNGRAFQDEVQGITAVATAGLWSAAIARFVTTSAVGCSTSLARTPSAYP